MTNFRIEASNIVLVSFPFTTLDQTKKRPALVLQSIRHSLKIQHSVLAMITSQIEGFKLEGDVELKDWKKSGLLHPSIIRLSKLVTVEFDLIQKNIGALSKSDNAAVKKSFSKLFKVWV